jgi:hypothetical protein
VTVSSMPRQKASLRDLEDFSFPFKFRTSINVASGNKNTADDCRQGGGVRKHYCVV